MSADSERQQFGVQQLLQHAPATATVDQASIAKQISLLSQSGLARQKEYEVFRNNSTNSSTTNMQQFAGGGGAPNPHAQAQAQAQAQALQQQRLSFLKSMLGFMQTNNIQIPFFVFSGIEPPPGYNHAAMPWHWLERGSSIGTVRPSGVESDIDLYVLWTTVMKQGSHNMTANNLWPQLTQYMRLPQQLPAPHHITGSPLMSEIVRKTFVDVLGPIEHLWNLRKAQTQPDASASSPATSATAHASTPTQAPTPVQSGDAAASPATSFHPSDTAVAPVTAATPAAPTPGPESDTNKRKSEELDGREPKKMKLDPALEPNSLPASPERAQTVDVERKPTPQPPPKMRNKIEYVPLNRELTTYGGRDLAAIESELANADKRPARGIDDYCHIDIETLELSMRSRTGPELSYALTALQLLSPMRSAQNPADREQQERGIPLSSAPELLDDLLDLIEETAFGAGYDGLDIGLGDLPKFPPFPAKDRDAATTRPWTHRELISFVHEEGSDLFAPVENDDTFAQRPMPRKVQHILASLNILANLAPTFENDQAMGRHPRLLQVLARLCTLDPPCAPANGPVTAPRSVSKALTLKDVIDVRKHVLLILYGLRPAHVHLKNASEERTRMLFDLLSSFVLDPEESLPPSQLIAALGGTQDSVPPALAEMALETFTQLSLADENRKHIARAIPAPRIAGLFNALVHRLPILERDYQTVFRQAWLVWTEHIIMALYTLAFLAPPSVKRAVRSDTRLGLGGILLRLVRRFTAAMPHPEYREHFTVVTRRAVELAKVIDDAEDVFDTPAATGGAILGFGMGYGESSVQRIEKGTGLYGGHQDAVWAVLAMGPGVLDDVMFAELDSLARLG